MDHRTLEIGNAAYFVHYRSKGEDYILRLWYGSSLQENGRVHQAWLMMIRHESGDWSRVMDCTRMLVARTQDH